jgi:hypothetical protein
VHSLPGFCFPSYRVYPWPRVVFPGPLLSSPMLAPPVSATTRPTRMDYTSMSWYLIFHPRVSGEKCRCTRPQSQQSTLSRTQSCVCCAPSNRTMRDSGVPRSGISQRDTGNLSNLTTRIPVITDIGRILLHGSRSGRHLDFWGRWPVPSDFSRFLLTLG